MQPLPYLEALCSLHASYEPASTIAQIIGRKYAEIVKDENDNIVHDNEKPRMHTDGTGFISEDLAVLCPYNVLEGRDSKNKYIKEIPNLVELKDMNKATGEAELSTRQPPLLIQCRLFHMDCAIKGTLLVNRKVYFSIFDRLFGSKN